MKKFHLFISLFFGLILALAMFIYSLYTIERNIKNYSSYIKSFNELISVETQLNNFLKKKSAFVNFDVITNSLKVFEKNIHFLINSDIKDDFGNKFTIDLKSLLKKYEKKRGLIEEFKSRELLNLNIMHNISELNQYFVNHKNISYPLKILINTTFSLTTQYLNGYSSMDKIFHLVKKIEVKNKKNKIKKIDSFIKQIKLLLNNVDYMYEMEQKLEGLNLSKDMNKIYKDLTIWHENKLSYKFLILLALFIFVIVVVILMYKEYLRSKQINNELHAFKYAVEHSDNVVVITDEHKKIIYVNEIFEKITGFKKEEVLGHDPRILNSGENPESTHIELNKKLHLGEKWEGEFINRKKDGSLYHEKASIVPIFLNNRLINYLAIKFDITKYIIQDEKIRLASIAFENMQEGVLIYDKDKIIIAVNSAFQHIMGYKASEIIGKELSIFHSELQDEVLYDSINESLIQRGSWKGKIHNQRKDGKIIPFLLNITAIKNDRGEILRYVALYANLEKIISSEKKAYFLAYHDSLTGLPNRAKLQKDLPPLLDFANRTNLNIFVLFIDLDRFKIINDTLGHAIGDKLLVIVADRIKVNLRNSDIISRMGGDEFIVVLESCKDKKSVGLVCNKILESLKEPIEIENTTLNVSASIGISTFPDDGFDMTALIKNADAAMYHAKKMGKNNYQYYNTELSLRIHEQLQIEQALKDSNLENEFYLKYQPQYDIKNKKIVSVEALLRWEHPILGAIATDKFIPIAEDIGEIIKINRFVLERVCKDFYNIKKENLSLKYIAINVSSFEFKNKDFVKDVCSILNKYEIKPYEIELEITERHIIDFTQESINMIAELKNLGFKFSIDDFGTEYSSLSYLTKLPIDILKIDKSFISQMNSDNSSIQIIKGIIALSKSLNYTVIAEGVEKEEQIKSLEELGCEIIQGYFFYKPLKLDDLMVLLKK